VATYPGIPGNLKILGENLDLPGIYNKIYPGIFWGFEKIFDFYKNIMYF